jgi:hypothetical protein
MYYKMYNINQCYSSSWDYMAKIADQRYACTMCNKQFLGPEFVIKHLSNKHSINVEDLIEVGSFLPIVWL